MKVTVLVDKLTSQIHSFQQHEIHRQIKITFMDRDKWYCIARKLTNLVDILATNFYFIKTKVTSSSLQIIHSKKAVEWIT